MSETRDLQNLSIRVAPRETGYNDRTILSDNIINWDPGAQAEQVTFGDTPSINGKIPTKKRKNTSRQSASLEVITGSSDEAYLDELCANAVECDIVVIDESSSEYGKEMTGTKVFFEEPESPYDGDSRAFVVKIAEFDRKRV